MDSDLLGKRLLRSNERQGKDDQSSLHLTILHRVVPRPSLADVQYWPPLKGGRPLVLIMFCPGNPGLLSYYEQFLSLLHASLPDDHAILAHSHIGHTPQLPAPIKPLLLSQQIDCKAELIGALRDELDNWCSSTDRRSKIALLGHSVGAYMVTELLKQHDDPSVISAGYLLFPTLGNIAMSANGMRLQPIFYQPLLSLLPLLAIVLPLILPLYRMLPLSGSLAPNDSTIRLLSSTKTIKHVLRLARSEMDSILEPDWAWYSRKDVQSRLWSYWGQSDGWVGDEGLKLRECLGSHADSKSEDCLGSRIAICRDNIPHAYCLAHSAKIADVVRGWVLRTFQDNELYCKSARIAR